MVCERIPGMVLGVPAMVFERRPGMVLGVPGMVLGVPDEVREMYREMYNVNNNA